MVKLYSSPVFLTGTESRMGRPTGTETMNDDTIRQIDKTLDVLRLVERSMMAEAEMNATKHMAATVRPVPLAGAVSALIGDLEAWRTRLNQ